MIVYKYGAREPAANLARVNEQMLLAHRYRNLLTEIERARRGAVGTTLNAVPAVQVATAIAEATPEGPARKLAWATVSAERKAAARSATTAAGILAINERAAAFRRLARSRCGCYWGTYLLAEQAADAQRQSGEEPRFRRWDGTGRVAVQLQGGLSVADALGGEDTRLRLAPLPDPPGMTPGSRRSGQRALVHLRVGSDGRAPIWTTLPVTLHRPLPSDGLIKWAILRRDRVGPDFRWSVQFTVDALPAHDSKAIPDRAGMVAVDLGWRVREDGTRVGYWQDDAGRHGEILMPGNVTADLAHIRSIGAIRDRLFNDFRDLLAGWMRDMSTFSDWLTREAATLPQWRSADRLARLASRWRGNRFAGDEAIYDTTPACPRDHNGALDCTSHVACWARKDHHLYRWEAHGMANILGRRNEAYRLVSADLARRYATVVIEKFKLPEVHGRAKLAPDASDGEKVRADRASSRRHATAPGEFRLALINACKQRGTVVIEVPCAYTTLDCAGCGYRDANWDAAPAIPHTCPACGVTDDQDRNAARNLLARYAASGPVAPGDGKVLAGGKSVRQQRFSRRRGNSVVGCGGYDG